MKNKILLLLSLVFALFMFPVMVNAENSIYFDADEINIAPGKTKKVDIIVDSEADFSKVNMSMITTSEFVNFQSVNFNEAFTRKTSGSAYELTSQIPQKSGTVIGSITIKASDNAPLGSNGYIRISKAVLTSSKNINLANAQLKVNISNEKSSNNNLSSISSQLINLDFSKENQKYNVDVENTVKELDLVATPEDQSATVKISNQKLEVGKNVINVTVKAENNEEKIYEITVNRKSLSGAKKESTKTTSSDENKKSNSKEGKGSWFIILVFLVGVLVIDLLYIKKKK